MTRRELKNLKNEVLNFHNDVKWKEGYCCYQEDNMNKFYLIEIGNNYGVYGWNWTLFYCTDNKTFYVSGYRNY